MFSEYASRFLARSNLRDSGRQSLYPASNAPLFFSAADYPTDDREHDQEVSAIYALQKSRRNLYYSPDQDEEERNDSDGGSVNDGIRSSWNPGNSGMSDITETAGSNNNLVDINLGDSLTDQNKGKNVLHRTDEHAGSYSEASRDAEDTSQPPIQKFRPQNNPHPQGFFRSKDQPEGIPQIHYQDDEEQQALFDRTRPGDTGLPNSTDADDLSSHIIPQPVDDASLMPPAHDRIWTKIYGVSMACMFATSFVVWLHTAEPKNRPIGDSIYKVLRNAIPLLAVDTLVAIVVACVWMICLKFFIRPLLYLIVISVPIVMLSLTIYPFVTSLGGPSGGGSFQDRVMRVTSLLPLILAGIWIYMLYQGRSALHKATSILQLALTIFTENPALLLCGFVTLISTIAFSWIWIFMVIRVFLNGNAAMIGGVPVWQMNSTAWVLGMFFVCVYLWTLGILSNLQRVTISATVSHWYFYRKSTGTFSPMTTFNAATHHALTTMFGSVCFSSLVELMIRLPLLVLPNRVGRFVHLVFFSLIASPILALSDPLTVTYAAVHSASLVPASRQINQLGLSGERIRAKETHTRHAYRLAKMLLTAARWMTSLALGIGAWVRTAHVVDGGSFYGYVVGLLAATIAWAILGAAERSLANIVDACLVCAASDNSDGRYCREAQMAFDGL